MESDQSFINNMVHWLQRIDDMFLVDCNKEDVYALLQLYTTIDRLKTKVKQSGLVLFNCKC